MVGDRLCKCAHMVPLHLDVYPTVHLTLLDKLPQLTGVLFEQ